MAGAALCRTGEERLAATRRIGVEAPLWWCRRRQPELVVAQSWQLRRDEIRCLGDIQLDARIVEVAASAHLRHRDIVVPVRDGAVCGERLEPDLPQTVRGRDDDGQRRLVERQQLRAVERVKARIVLARSPAFEDRPLLVGQHRRQRDDGADVQVAVWPAVESFPDSRAERVVHRRMAQRARHADRFQFPPGHFSNDANHRVG